jgi:hypothetical protein
MNTFNPLAPRRFGVELEVSRRLTCVNYEGKSYSPQWNELQTMVSNLRDHRKVGDWKVKVDTSCGGELVSPILTGQNGLKEVAIICDRVKQIGKKYGLPVVDGECGLHVHIDVADIKPRQLSNLAILVYLAEPIIYAMYPNRNHEYCAPIDMNMRLVSKWSDWIDVRDTWYRSSNNVKDKTVVYEDRFINAVNGHGGGNHYDGTRYHGFNIHCYWRQHTVEFRYAAGTLDPLHVKAYYEMCLAMVNTAMASKKPIQVDESFLNMKYPMLRQHYASAYRFRKMLVDVAKRCNWSRATMRLIISLLKKNSPGLLMKDPMRHRITITADTRNRYWYFDAIRATYYDGNGQKVAMTNKKMSQRPVLEVTLHGAGTKFQLTSNNRNLVFNHIIWVDPHQKMPELSAQEVADATAALVGNGPTWANATAAPVADADFFATQFTTGNQ